MPTREACPTSGSRPTAWAWHPKGMPPDRPMAKTPSPFDRAVKAAMSAAAEAGDVSRLPAELRAVALVHAAQGVIDNGGLQYFFESDFPGKPSYKLFVDAYQAIGATDAADALAKAVALFPFADPHRHAKRRNAFLDGFNDEDDEPVNSPFELLTQRLCGDKEVWRRLRAYVERNAETLGV